MSFQSMIIWQSEYCIKLAHTRPGQDRTKTATHQFSEKKQNFISNVTHKTFFCFSPIMVHFRLKKNLWLFQLCQSLNAKSHDLSKDEIPPCKLELSNQLIVFYATYSCNYCMDTPLSPGRYCCSQELSP